MPTRHKNMFSARIRNIDIQEGEHLSVIINEHDASEYGITSMDKVSVIYGDQEFVFDANITNTLVHPGEIGMTKDIQEKYHGLAAGSIVTVSYTTNSSASLEALKK